MAKLVELAIRAGEETMEVYTPDFEVPSKADESPPPPLIRRRHR
jgi:hypothetical protein